MCWPKTATIATATKLSWKSQNETLPCWSVPLRLSASGREGKAHPWREEFSELVRQGQMVRAVKLHREKTGSTVKKAKEAHDDERALVFREELS